MERSRHGATLRNVGVLLAAGTFADSSDRQLLERYATARDEASELAFTALVERHGSMVLRVCRDVLGDEHEAQDAFQATFLVLARRADGLRPRDWLGPWLHEVATRVSLSARSATLRRRRHERRAAELAPRSVAAQVSDDVSLALHEEVDRLPGPYRAAVVLCCLQGLTHEQAARQLGCPLGTVLSRVARGRERLRGRLVRRGLAPAGVAVALAEPSRGAIAVPPALADAAIRGATQITTAASSTAAILAEGVLRTMMLSKLRVAVAGLFSIAIVAGGGGIIAQTTARENDPPATATKGGQPLTAAAQEGEQPPRKPTEYDYNRRLVETVRRHLDRLVQAARRRFEAQQAFYQEGRITIDRVLDASEQLRNAEAQANPTREGRSAAARAHLDRVKSIEDRERDELAVGRSTQADVAEATQGRERAELGLLEAVQEPSLSEVKDLQARVKSLEDRLDRVLKELEEMKRPVNRRGL